MKFAQKAFEELYPDREAEVEVEYSGRLKSYGSRVAYDLSKRRLKFTLNKKWRHVDEDIRMGLVQCLLLKVFKDKRRTLHSDLYNNFVKNLHIAIPKNKIDPLLKESFDRVNEKYFLGAVEMPNLVFGRDSTTTLGHYDYKTDTITISTIFNKRHDLLDFVMYHEMLHKVHKFKAGLTNRYHSSKFKKAEKSYENCEKIEKELGKFLRMRRVKGWFGF
ncbi:hypothetical protein KY308_00835 [Candidatus Woesearchaeota archaeon]|nr:hypothetical protein [Candidatus Woesearchaeota archaeon]